MVCVRFARFGGLSDQVMGRSVGFAFEQLSVQIPHDPLDFVDVLHHFAQCCVLLLVLSVQGFPRNQGPYFDVLVVD